MEKVRKGRLNMVKELKKGNNVPYHGYLLNIHEYEKYTQFQKIAPALLEYIQQEKEGNRLG